LVFEEKKKLFFICLSLNLISFLETRVPGQPVDLFTEPTDKSIVIRWLPPSDSNKTLVRKYLLKYGIGYPSNEVQISGTRNSYIINDLSNFIFV